LGEPLDVLKYINLGWHQRVKFVSEVLDFLERLRPLVFLDFRRQQVGSLDEGWNVVDVFSLR
jgi:hypothetical protein